MDLSDEVKKQILDGFMDIFSRLSSKEYQQRVWIQGDGPEVDAFDDTVCDYFTEGGSILAHYKEFGITEEQYQVLKEFRDEFEKFSDGNDWPELFINTPEWTRITELAKKVLNAFNYRKPKHFC